MLADLQISDFHFLYKSLRGVRTHPCEHRVCSGAALLAQQQCPKRPALLYHCRLSVHPLPPRLSDCPGMATRAPALPQAAPRPCSSVWVQCRRVPGAKAAPGWCCPESGRWAAPVGIASGVLLVPSPVCSQAQPYSPTALHGSGL